MQWEDEGIVIEARRLGEGGVVLSLMTRDHGRHLGLVHGASGPARRAMIQPGNSLTAKWRGRLADHLGTYSLEPQRLRSAALLGPGPLTALSSACVLLTACLPEREPHPRLYEALTLLCDALNTEDIWPALYVRWELGLLQELGFGLNLDACALSGAADNLTHVSPRTGRAVCAAEAEPYADKLLALPAFLAPAGKDRSAEAEDIANGLTLTGFFLERQLLAAQDKDMPEARRRLAARFSATRAPGP